VPRSVEVNELPPALLFRLHLPGNRQVDLDFEPERAPATEAA
jgi:hypothetical protein